MFEQQHGGGGGEAQQRELPDFIDEGHQVGLSEQGVVDGSRGQGRRLGHAHLGGPNSLHRLRCALVRGIVGREMRDQNGEGSMEAACPEGKLLPGNCVCV